MFPTLTTAILLLTVPTWAEWVEISQHHYRKPVRIHSAFTTPARTIFVEETTKPTYINRSFTENHWKTSPKTPANIRRVDFFTTSKTTETPKIQDDEYPDLEAIDYEIPIEEELQPTKVKINQHGKPKGTVERVSNIGNVKRVYLNSTPVKSPALKAKGERNPNNNEPRSPTGSSEDNNNVFKVKNSLENNPQRFDVSKLQKPRVTEKPLIINEENVSEETVNSIKNPSMFGYKNYTTFVKNFHPAKPTFVTEIETDLPDTSGNSRLYKITDTKLLSTQKTKVFSNAPINDEDPGDPTSSDDNDNFSDDTTKSNVPKVNKQSEETNNLYETESHKNPVSHSEDDGKQRINKPKQRVKPATRYQEEHKNDKEMNDKVHTIENLMKFMRVVADTISRNSRRSVGGKMQYLHELKDTILNTIQDRIEATWPDDDTGAHRRSRAAEATPRGHVQFPSSESALMTISFLTFAVFLIKLVLQVIQTYKNKTMMVAPLVVSSGRNILKRTRN